MTEHRSVDVPRVDDSVDTRTIRDMAERIAVPNFDWVAEPIGAIVDGLTGLDHHEKGGQQAVQPPSTTST